MFKVLCDGFCMHDAGCYIFNQTAHFAHFCENISHTSQYVLINLLGALKSGAHNLVGKLIRSEIYCA